MKYITFAEGRGWQGLYVNGELVAEGKRLESYHWNDMLKEITPARVEISYKEIPDGCWDVYPEGLPHYLGDITRG